ncbi:MAG: methionyl-tRNA formyltransferase [Flavobacteriaceae bacterium]
MTPIKVLDPKKVNIVFFGTPEFAAHQLEVLISEHYNVVAVVTAPDRGAGRGQKTKPSAVKELAIAHEIKIFQPPNLKDETFINSLAHIKAHLFVVVAFRMLPKLVWSIPEYGTFNLHASLLPDYRGAAPINWALINGEKKTGVSTFLIDHKIDTGDVLLQEEVEIQKEDDLKSLHHKLMLLGGPLITKTIKGLVEGSVVAKKQKQNFHLKSAPKLNQENTKIDWKQNGGHIENLIKGLSPYPAAWTHFVEDDQIFRLKIYKATYLNQKHQLQAGHFDIKDQKINIAVPDGYIVVDELQFPNKKRMNVKDLLNGRKLKENAFFE